MMLANVVASGQKIPIGEAAVTALLGYSVVFLGLFMLMVVVIIMSKIMMGATKKAEAPKAEAPAAAAPVAAAAPAGPVAPGSAGKIKLYDTPDRDAAMIMAIVANKLNKPLNELRFISIKEVK